MNWDQFFATLRNWATTFGVRLLISIVLLVVSFALINRLARAVAARGEKRHADGKQKIDETICRTVSYIVKVGLKVLVVLMLVSYLGIDTTAVSALIASLGVGVGLAVNGTLSNFAGGVLLLFTRPFRDGDFIAAGGYEGTVEDIFICNTKIRTNDNKVVYLPNGKLSTSEITNYSEKPTRRVDLTFSISYGDDFARAADIIRSVAAADPLVLADPAPRARVTRHGESSVDLFTTVWCKTADYWEVYFNMNEGVKRAFDENGISIPFPQMDVHHDR